jgi:hypothetical protein
MSGWRNGWIGGPSFHKFSKVSALEYFPYTVTIRGLLRVFTISSDPSLALPPPPPTSAPSRYCANYSWKRETDRERERKRERERERDMEREREKERDR